MFSFLDNQVRLCIFVTEKANNKHFEFGIFDEIF